ncbi:MAG: diguanylate cyclase [Gemmatimonas sp.]|uniref:GGDEF domain-containing protein n=1 Tax=Gemmatimonas sp. TaxID=1962908 RepID=UPI0022BEF4D6|nr:GGDEF domain-containing protein [Gemmatimonas sp.]MCA2984233.1 GGDEF domain-containing protein [Gemmatimonas sp.]MCA2987523.1 GGDEF domain-containing protein [Gemmatimonas sp.]MCA2995156.1 GGDEF domain-containing protein [Gemmatimonas sp.]MCE2953873.1 GGDEF domain-containing protein [Gemmatimonas sp.]MCZ8010798.1 GGDEF domain-containing protein [Gemmatimonas sp.]
MNAQRERYAREGISETIPVKSTTRIRRWFRLDSESLTPYRTRIVAALSLPAALLLLPFTMTHLLYGRWGLAVVIAIAQVVLFVDGRAASRNLPPPVPHLALAMILMVVVFASLAFQGINGALWAYPTLFICYFILPRGRALGVSSVIVVAVSLIAYDSLGGALAARLAATLALTLGMINVVLNVIDDLQQALQDQAVTDALTGAYNRRRFDEELARIELTAAQGQTCTLLTLDVDHFKRVNDTYGHAVGDEVLRRVAALIKARKRRDDMLFRIGGEEFALLLPGCGATEAAALAEVLRKRIEQAEMPAGQCITVSVGVANHIVGDTPEAWARRVDAALYLAKRQGRNRVIVSGLTAPAEQIQPVSV